MTSPTKTEDRSQLIVRSDVPLGLSYTEYKQELRYDFFYSCAYCTMCETEATGIRFTIDHYEPQSARPDLRNFYSNLMYACDECNIRKGDRIPSQSARQSHFRFFRPDNDHFEDHFELKGLRISSKSEIGYFTIEALDLNRQGLRRIREIRDRLTASSELVAGGIRGLRTFHIDRLPPAVRGDVLRTIGRATGLQDQLDAEVDALLRKYAQAPILDPDQDAPERAKERARRLAELRVLYPGIWRGRDGAKA
jgi:HNH endonuclease